MKYVLLTGGAGGLGGICTKALASRGYTVFAADINEDALREIGKTPGILPLSMDITSQDSIEKAKQTVLQTTQTLDAVINFAGIHTLSSLIEGNSPELIEKMNLQETEGGLKVGVRKIIDASVMGSGLGAVNSVSGDYDITLHDKQICQQYGLDKLRFGDIVAIMDADTRYGRNFVTGAITIGVVVHSDCILSGHGPGVTTLMTCKTAQIEPVIDENANLADYFLK